MKQQKTSTLTNVVHHKSCCDSSDVEDELSHPNFPSPYKPFGNPLWISHMYILIYAHSIISMKQSPCLNPAIKPTGVTLIVRHRCES